MRQSTARPRVIARTAAGAIGYAQRGDVPAAERLA
jgi:hypothetical protein